MTVDAAAPEQADLLAFGRVVTMNAASEIVPDGGIAVRDKCIVAVGSREDIAGRYRAPRSLDRRHAILIPGLIDCHTHMSQALVRAMIAHELPMIYRIYAPVTQSMTPDDAHVAASLCAAQLLLSGVTTVCEGTIGASDEHLAAITEAVAEAGIRSNIVIGRPDQDFHHAALYSQARDRSWLKVREGVAERELERTEAFLARHPPAGAALITGGICPSSLTGYSERYFRLAHDLARRTGGKLHVHAARDREEVEFCLAVFGRRPIERLSDVGVVGKHLVVAHAMLATDYELVLLGQGHAAVAHSAIECLNILNAVPNVRLMRELGITVGLGCDNAVNDMFSVMRGAWILHTATRGIRGYDPEILDAGAILAMATRDAGALLGLNRHIGSLEPGKRADFVVLDGSGPHLRPSLDVETELVRYACRGDVCDVVVDGRLVVDDRRLCTLDLEQVQEKAEMAVHRLRPLAAKGRYR
jgi:5-methylthioadenosine/S-adenosylhomocysteine deaminase